MRSRKAISLVLVPTGCNFNPQCPHVLLSGGCREALETRACASLAQAAILTGLGTYTRSMRKHQRR